MCIDIFCWLVLYVHYSFKKSLVICCSDVMGEISVISNNGENRQVLLLAPKTNKQELLFYVTLPQIAKHSGNLLLPLHLESASENALFGEPFGRLDDHYPLKQDTLPYLGACKMEG